MLPLFSDFLNLFSARHCAVCGRPLSAGERSVCGGCLLGLPYMMEPDFYDNPVSRLLWAKMPLERAYSFLWYRKDDLSAPLLHQLKYRHRPDVGREMGRMMAHDLLARGFFADVDAIVAVPLHWIRQFRRGYNQSQALALGVSEVTGIPVLQRWVKRVRNNATQTRKTAAERTANTEQLFRARPGMPCRHVLIVDDVLTTGATAASCASAIVQTNPHVRISVLTLAKT